MLATYDLVPSAVENLPATEDRIAGRTAFEPTEIRALSTIDVLGLNEQLMGEGALRDGALLDSAVNNPFQTFGGACNVGFFENQRA